MTSITDNDLSKYYSLFEFFGEVNGRSNRNKEIYALAKQLGIKVLARDVKRKTFVGKVMLYPKWFLITFQKGGFKWLGEKDNENEHCDELTISHTKEYLEYYNNK